MRVNEREGRERERGGGGGGSEFQAGEYGEMKMRGAIVIL